MSGRRDFEDPATYHASSATRSNGTCYNKRETHLSLSGGSPTLNPRLCQLTISFGIDIVSAIYEIVSVMQVLNGDCV